MKKTAFLLTLAFLLLTAVCFTSCDVPFLTEADEAIGAFVDTAVFKVTGEHECTPGEWQTVMEAENCTSDGLRCRYCLFCNKLMDSERVKAPHAIEDITPGSVATCQHCNCVFGWVPALENDDGTGAVCVSDFGIFQVLFARTVETVYVPAYYQDKPVTTIYGETFADFSALKTVYLPATIEKIGASAFDGCENLTDIYYDGTLENWDAVSFGDLWDNGVNAYTVHCTDGYVEFTELQFD